MLKYTEVCNSDYEAPATYAEETEIKLLTPCRVYKRRWVILCLFVIYSVINIMQWVQYTIIADVLVKYYGISYTAADWSATIYLLLYIPFNFPGSYFLEKMGPRAAVLLGMIGTCIGAWIKVASVAPDRYWVLLFGQSFVAIADVLLLPVPPKLAAVWFGPKEVSSACSIGVFGVQLGTAVGFVIPPLLVNSQMGQDIIENSLFTIALAVAVACSVVMLLLFLCFQDHPPTPPVTTKFSICKEKNESTSFCQSIKNLIMNRSFMLFFVAYGINVGVYYTLSMLLNQIILKYHPNAAAEAGVVGLTIIISSMVGSIVGGIILDKFGRFRVTILAAYAISLAAITAFTFTIQENMGVIYFISSLIGLSMGGIMTIGLEVGVELTYPEPEGTSGGLLTTSAQFFGTILTYLYAILFEKVGDIYANLTMCAALVFGLLLTAWLRFNLQRQKAQAAPDVAK